MVRIIFLYKYVNECQNIGKERKQSVCFGVDVPDAKNEFAEVFGVGDAICVGDAGGCGRIGWG